jgi:hypothetical protein
LSGWQARGRFVSENRPAGLAELLVEAAVHNRGSDEQPPVRLSGSATGQENELRIYQMRFRG